MADDNGRLDDLSAVKSALANSDNYTFLVKKYEPKIINFIIKISGMGREEAEDVAQEIFLKAYINLNDFDPEKKFSTWLFSIAHNETISYWRKHSKRWQNVSLDNSGIINTILAEVNLDKRIDSDQIAKQVNKALQEIDIKYREVLQLKYLHEYSYEEISDIIKKPLNTVGVLISRGKDKLKKILVNNKNE
ncbi:MAG: RNA polymerase sigma factor [Patescibacteria group bacterium]